MQVYALHVYACVSVCMHSALAMFSICVSMYFYACVCMCMHCMCMHVYAFSTRDILFNMFCFPHV